MARVKAARPSRLSKTSWRRDFKMNWAVYLVFLPILVYFIIFHFLPMFGIVMAFQDFNATKGFFGSDFVGLKNFIDFFSGPSFLSILRNTLVISLLGLGIGFPLSIVLALLLNEIRFTRFKKVVQTISYMPYFVSAVVICGLIIDFVSSNGIITNLLVALGMPRQNLLTNPAYFWWINLISDIWQGPTSPAPTAYPSPSASALRAGCSPHPTAKPSSTTARTWRAMSSSP